MSEPTLHHLHLGSALLYEAFERDIDPWADPPKDGDCVWLFASQDLIDTGDTGPRFKTPLPRPLFSGKARRLGAMLSEKSPEALDGNAIAEDMNNTTKLLPAGDYVFTQWRERDCARVQDGFEEFARQVWWEGEKTEGPWILRIVAEDGDTAYQGLRRMSDS